MHYLNEGRRSWNPGAHYTANRTGIEYFASLRPLRFERETEYDSVVGFPGPRSNFKGLFVMHDIIPYRERTLTKRPTIPDRVRENQDRIIHGELIHRRKLLASMMEAPLTKIPPQSQ